MRSLLLLLLSVVVFSLSSAHAEKKVVDGDVSVSPLGVWTYSQDLKRKTDTGAEKVVGIVTTTVTIEKAGDYREFITVEYLIKNPEQEPIEFKGKWRQIGNVVHFKRNNADKAYGFSLDKTGDRMTFREGGHQVSMVRRKTKASQADQNSDPLAKQFPLLARLKLPSSQLPPNCKTQELPKGVPELKNLRNLSITTDASLFLLGCRPVKDKIDAGTISAAYFGIYKERNELGVMGWCFKSADHAKNAHDVLAAAYPDADQHRLWVIGDHVIWVWCDAGTSNFAFQRIGNYVDSQLR